jgi:hypothetical protein
VEPKDSPNKTVSVRQPKSVKPTPPASAESVPAEDAPSPPKKPPRHTASANPVSPDDLLADPAMDWGASWTPVVSAFAVGLVVGLIAGILAARD